MGSNNKTTLEQQLNGEDANILSSIEEKGGGGKRGREAGAGRGGGGGRLYTPSISALRIVPRACREARKQAGKRHPLLLLLAQLLVSPRVGKVSPATAWQDPLKTSGRQWQPNVPRTWSTRCARAYVSHVRPAARQGKQLRGEERS